MLTREELERQLRTLCQTQQWEEATRVALKGYGPEILGWAIAFTKETTEAEDICQLFSVALWKGLPGFRWESSLRVWAYKIARRELVRYQIARESRRECQLPSQELAQEITTLHSQLQRKHQTNRLIELRQQLSEEMQTLLILRVDREMSFAEIGAVLEIEEESARQKFKRAKDQLKEMAKREGLLQ